MIYPIKAPFFKVKSTQPTCHNCRYSTEHNATTVCKLFKYSTIINIVQPLKEIKYDFYLNASDCRKNEFLCGPNALHFKEK